MTWKKLLGGHDIQPHRTSKKELDDMRALVARDLADAGIAGLSADRRFATAYNAALQAANMAIACAGYRVTAKTGHHKMTFYGANIALGSVADKYADYFETCRRKRNAIDYTRSQIVSSHCKSRGDKRNFLHGSENPFLVIQLSGPPF